LDEMITIRLHLDDCNEDNGLCGFSPAHTAGGDSRQKRSRDFARNSRTSCAAPRQGMRFSCGLCCCTRPAGPGVRCIDACCT
jgi:hypothetical protein